MSIELLQSWLRPARRLLVVGCIVAGGWRAFASDSPARLSPVAQFPVPVSPYALIQAAQPQMPLTLVGPRGAFLGQQSGNLEAWIFPVKLFSNFHISARLQNYPVDIDVTELVRIGCRHGMRTRAGRIRSERRGCAAIFCFNQAWCSLGYRYLNGKATKTKLDR